MPWSLARAAGKVIDSQSGEGIEPHFDDIRVMRRDAVVNLQGVLQSLRSAVVQQRIGREIFLLVAGLGIREKAPDRVRLRGSRLCSRLVFFGV